MIRTALMLAAAIAGTTPAIARCTKGQTISWYGEPRLQPRHPAAVGCASRDHPKGTKLRVTDLDSGLSVVCTVDDWGPMAWTGCRADMGPKAAAALRMTGKGVARARIERIPPGSLAQIAETAPAAGLVARDRK